jgi:hypothetical protein
MGAIVTAPIETTDEEGRAVFAYLVDDMEITNPTVSECGRFEVSADHFGLTPEQVDRLDLLNRTMRGES